MLTRQNNDPLTISQHARLHTLEGADKGVDAEQPVLLLQVGSHLDPGLRRKDRPNEDTLFVTQGVMPSASASLKPFALLMVASCLQGLNQPWCPGDPTVWTSLRVGQITRSGTNGGMALAGVAGSLLVACRGLTTAWMSLAVGQITRLAQVVEWLSLGWLGVSWRCADVATGSSVMGLQPHRCLC